MNELHSGQAPLQETAGTWHTILLRVASQPQSVAIVDPSLTDRRESPFRKLFNSITDPIACLHNLFLAPIPDSLNSRLRSYEIYQGPPHAQNFYYPFVHYALSLYQTRIQKQMQVNYRTVFLLICATLISALIVVCTVYNACTVLTWTAHVPYVYA